MLGKLVPIEVGAKMKRPAGEGISTKRRESTTKYNDLVIELQG